MSENQFSVGEKATHFIIDEVAKANTNFRQVLYTAKDCQLVLMSLLPGEDIGLEVHKGGDQFFRFESGEGKVVINEADLEQAKTELKNRIQAFIFGNHNLHFEHCLINFISFSQINQINNFIMYFLKI